MKFTIWKAIPTAQILFFQINYRFDWYKYMNVGNRKGQIYDLTRTVKAEQAQFRDRAVLFTDCVFFFNEFNFTKTSFLLERTLFNTT